MISKFLRSAASTALILAFVDPSMAQIIVDPRFPGNFLEHRVTVRLTATSQGPEIVRPTRNGSSISSRAITERISNRNILRVFAELDVIPNIQGWSLVVASADGFPARFILLKRGQEPIDVDSYFAYDADTANAVVSYRAQSVIADEIEFYSERFEAKALGYIDFRFGPSNTTLALDGMANFSGRFEELYDLIFDEPLESESFLDAFTLASGVGVVQQDADDDGALFLSTLEGSYILARGRQTGIIEIR